MKIDLIIAGGDVYTPERIISPGMVAISGDKIAFCRKMGRMDNVPCIDASGKIPGKFQGQPLNSKYSFTGAEE
ncbi:MAG: hypothetical protein L6437_01715 [Kiritimatiellae bacterium]|nr:hypothetical protein [Verrucomicrobiota bacterium]MBU4285628.1 hypothetical protein [Verrucomicrobiota bacterium]MBU4366833.1 hypothetical protein [Verrucomicrobiota bacterium]MCG2658948.1 hypothetical protein [Kiritimatiellia bacterium]